MSGSTERVRIKPKPGTSARIGKTVDDKTVYVSWILICLLKEKGWSGSEKHAVSLVCVPRPVPELECDLYAIKLASGQLITSETEPRKTKPFAGEVVVHIWDFEEAPYRGVCEGLVVSIDPKVYREMRKLANASQDLRPTANLKDFFAFDCRVSPNQRPSPPYALTDLNHVKKCVGLAGERRKAEYGEGLAAFAAHIKRRAALAVSEDAAPDADAGLDISEVITEALKAQKRAKEREEKRHKQ